MMNRRALNVFYRRHNFTLAFIIIGAVVVGIGAFVVRDMRRSNQEVRHMYSDLVQDFDSTVELQYQTQESRRSMLYALTTTDSNRQLDYADQSRAAEAQVQELIEEAKKVASSASEAEATSNLEREWAVYLKIRDEVIGEILEGSIDAAIQRDLREGVPAFDRVRAALQALMQVQKEDAQHSVASVETSSNSSLLKLITISCLTLLLAGIAVKTIQKSKMLQVVRNNEQRFRSLIENSSDAIALFNKYGTVLYASPSTPQVLGYSPEELTASNVLEIIHADDRELVAERLRQALKQPRVGIDVLARARHKDGSWRWIEGSLTNLLDEPSVGAVVDNYRDVTERKRVDEEKAKLIVQIEDQRQRLNTIITSVPGMVWEAWGQPDVASQHTNFASDYVERLVGYSVDEWCTTPNMWLSIVHPDDRERAAREMGANYASGKGGTIEFRWITKEGDVIWVTTQYVIATDTDGTPIGVRGVTTNIDERKRAEEEQRRLQDERNQLLEQLQLQIDVMPLAFVISDTNYRTTSWNPAAERMFGFTKEEILGNAGYQLIVSAAARPYVEEVFGRIASGESISTLASENITKDGKTILCDWFAAPLKSANGSCIGIMAMAQDVTERKQGEVTRARLEAQLRQSQKMEAIGTLAGGIAHDFNNILAAIIGYCELALMDLPGDSKTTTRLNEVLKAGNRAKELVRQILTFSRQAEHDLKPIKVQPIIEEALKLLRASLPSSIDIRQNIEPAAPSILGDPTEIHQVVMNLGTNAWHAIKERDGVLEVRLTSLEIDTDFAAAHDLKPGPHIHLSVSDSGCGMDRATVERIFEPFFTTKPPGSGTGLGLAVVHGVIKKHGGAITVYSEPAKGTIFNLYWPVHDRDVAPAMPRPNVIPRGAGERILFVDDEESLASLGKSMLERLGYRVTTEISSVKALKLFAGQPGGFDLVITDQTMPNMSGVDLAKALLEIRPELPVILATGYSTAINPEKAHALGIRELLLKPNTAQSLGEAIRRALGQNGKE
jgi:PAS domain S-box-containing protein